MTIALASLSVQLHTASASAITPEDAKVLINAAAKKYAVNADHLYETLKCESLNFKDPDIQSGHVKNGVRENSWGYAQFNLPTDLKTADGRIITKAIATNPYEAIDAAAYQFSIDNASRWSCWQKLYGKTR